MGRTPALPPINLRLPAPLPRANPSHHRPRCRGFRWGGVFPRVLGGLMVIPASLHTAFLQAQVRAACCPGRWGTGRGPPGADSSQAISGFLAFLGPARPGLTASFIPICPQVLEACSYHRGPGVWLSPGPLWPSLHGAHNLTLDLGSTPSLCRIPQWTDPQQTTVPRWGAGAGRGRREQCGALPPTLCWGSAGW